MSLDGPNRLLLLDSLKRFLGEEELLSKILNLNFELVEVEEVHLEKVPYVFLR